MLSDKDGPKWSKLQNKKKLSLVFLFFKRVIFTQNFFGRKKNKTDQAYSLGLKMTIVLLPKKNNFDELYGKYINICGTKLVSLDRYLNIVFNEFI